MRAHCTAGEGGEGAGRGARQKSSADATKSLSRATRALYLDARRKPFRCGPPTRGVTRRFYSRSWAVCARAFRAGRAGLRGEGRPRGFLPSSGGYGERERGRAKLRGGLSHRRFPEEAGVLPQPDPILVGAYISDSTGARRKRRGRGVSVGEGACGGREGRARHVGAAQHASWQRRRTWRIAQAGEALQSGGG